MGGGASQIWLVVALFLHRAAVGAAQTLSSASVAPPSVNTSLGPAIVTFTLTATSSAFTSCLGTVVAPTGYTLQAPFTVVDSFGTQTLSGAFTLPRFAPQGSWVLANLACADVSSVWRNFSRVSFSTEVQVGSTFAQVSVGPPAILGATVSPANFTVFHGDMLVFATITALSDAVGINWCRASFTTPDSAGTLACTANIFNQQQATTFAALPCSFSVSSSALRGTYPLTRLECVDNAGRSNVLTSVPPAALFNVSFFQTSLQDRTPPTINSLVISPTSVNTSTASVTLSAVFQVQDNPGGSGVRSCSITVMNSVSFSFSASTAAPVFSGTVTVLLVLPRAAPQGLFTVSRASCSDPWDSTSLSAARFAPLSFTQVGVGDTAAPAILNWSFDASNVDISASSATVSLAIAVTDDLSGISTCNAEILNAVSLQTRSCSVTPPAGTPMRSGTLLCPFSFPQFAPNGTWTLRQIVCRDSVQRATTVTFTSFNSTSLFVSGPTDLAPPVISRVSVTPRTFDSQLGPTTVSIVISVTDDASGVWWCDASLRRPDGVSMSGSSFLSSIGMTAGDVTIQLSLPRFAPQGTYVFTSIRCYDRISGSSFFTALSTLSLTQTAANTDLQPPSVTGISFSTQTINTFASAASFTVSLTVQDDTSGVQQCSVTMLGPSTSSSWSRTTQNNPLSTVLVIPASLPRYSPQGNWTLTTVTCLDTLGRSISYSRTELISLFPSAQLFVTQTGQGDTMPISILGFSITPLFVDTSSSSAQLSLQLFYLDDLSGVGYCYAEMQQPDGQSFSVYMPPPPSVAIQGSMTTSYTLPAFSPTGQYRLTRVYCDDASGKFSAVAESDFPARWGVTLPFGFVQTGTADLLPPEIISLSISPRVFNTTLSSVSILATFTCRDELSGCRTCSAQYSSTTAGSTSQSCTTPSLPAASQPSALQTLTCAITFPQFSPNGAWTLSSASCSDQAARTTSLPVSARQALSVNQTGVPDMQPPQILGVQVSPSTVATGLRSATVTVQVTFLDDLAGFRSGYLYINGPLGSNDFVALSMTRGALSGTAVGTYSLPRSSPTGTYFVSSIQIFDVSGKTASISNPLTIQALGNVSFSQTDVGDSSPPAITGFAFSQLVIDTSMSSVPVTAVISVTDDLSGISYCDAFVSPPPGSQDSSRSCTTQSFPAGQILAGNISCVFSIPRFASVGAWTLNYVQCFDNRNSVGYAYFPADLSGPATSFTQVGLPDVRSPNITFFSLSPATVRTFDAAASINIVVRASDDVSGISQCSVLFSGPLSTSVQQSFSSTLPNQLSATVTGSLTVSRFSPMGTYTLQNLECRDASGKRTSLGPAQFLSSLGGASFSFQQTSPGDVSLPTLSGLRVAPSQIDTSLSSQFVNLSLDLSDDMSGISYCSVWMLSPDSSRSVSCTTATFAAFQLMNGTVACPVSVPRFAAFGAWTWNSLACYDVANKELYLSNAALSALSGSAIAFTQTGRADVSPPLIHALALAPAAINTSASSAFVNVTVWASDDVAGVQSCRITVLFPGSPPSSRSFAFSSYSAINSSYGFVVGSIAMGQGSAPGAYNLTSASCTDATDKALTLSGAGLAALVPSMIAFVQVSVGDLFPPVISSVRFSPAVVNTSLISASINATIFVSDDFSGVRSCSVFLISPSGATSPSCSTPTLTQGQLLAGTVSCALVLPAFSERGNWTFNRVQCTDLQGRTTLLFAGDPLVLAFSPPSSLRVSQVGLGDARPPSVTAIVFAPTVIDTSAAAVPVNVSLIVQDDVSGLSSCSMSLRSPDGSSVDLWSFAPFGAVSGAFSTLFTFPALSPRGFYSVISLDCTDRAGRSVSFSSGAITGTFGVVGVNQTGIGDSAPVRVHSVLFSPSNVNCNEGPQTITASLNVSDDFSGVQRCSVTLQNPRGGTQSCQTAFLPPGTLSALLNCSLVLVQFAPQGLWLLSSVECWDNAGRYQSQSRALLTSNRVPFNAVNQSGAGDTSGPQLLNFTVTTIAPTVDVHANDTLVTVDSSANISLLNFTWDFTDDISGVTSCSVTLLLPSGSSTTISASTSVARRSDILWAQYTVPMFADPGLYNASQISCRDAVSNSGVLAGAAGRTLFAVVGRQDLFAPQIVGVSPSMANITTTATQGASFLVFLNVTDDLTGISSCDMVFRSRVLPSSASVSCFFMRQTSTRTPNGGNQTVIANVTLSCSFPSNSISGEWNCTRLRCVDVRSRATLLVSPAEFAAAGLPVPLVNQLGPADLARPNITFFAFSTNSINTSESAVALSATLSVTDDVGVRSCMVSLMGPDRSTQSWSSAISPPGLVAANITIPITISRYAPQGRWNITELSCRDFVSNSISLSPPWTAFFPSAESMSFSFQQVGPADTTGANITALFLDPAIVNTSGTSAAVRVNLSWVDDFSGLSYGEAIFSSPVGAPASFLSCYFSQQMRNVQAGTVACTLWVPRWSALGEWRVASLYTMDYANRRRDQSPVAFPALNVSFLQVGRSDVRPPMVFGFRLLNASVDTSSTSNAFVFMAANITDDVSGLSSCTLTFLDPLRAAVSFNFFVMESGAAVPGGSGEALLRASLMRDMPQGQYNLTSFFCSDNAGRTVTISNLAVLTALAQTPASLAFVQTGQGDATPPNITSLTFSPQAVLPGREAVFAVTVGFVDDRSGLSYCSVRFSGSRSLSLTGYVSDDESVLSGTLTDGRLMYTVKWTAPNVSTPLILRMTSAFCVDRYDRRRTYSGSALEQFGLTGDRLNLTVTSVLPDANTASESSSQSVAPIAAGAVVGALLLLLALAALLFVQRRNSNRKRVASMLSSARTSSSLGAAGTNRASSSASRATADRSKGLAPEDKGLEYNPLATAPRMRFHQANPMYGQEEGSPAQPIYKAYVSQQGQPVASDAGLYTPVGDYAAQPAYSIPLEGGGGEAIYSAVNDDLMMYDGCLTDPNEAQTYYYSPVGGTSTDVAVHQLTRSNSLLGSSDDYTPVGASEQAPPRPRKPAASAALGDPGIPMGRYYYSQPNAATSIAPIDLYDTIESPSPSGHSTTRI